MININANRAIDNYEQPNFYSKYKQAVNDRNRARKRPSSYSKANLKPSSMQNGKSKAQILANFYENLEKTEFSGRRVSVKDQLMNTKNYHKKNKTDQDMIIKQSKM